MGSSRRTSPSRSVPHGAAERAAADFRAVDADVDSGQLIAVQLATGPPDARCRRRQPGAVAVPQATTRRSISRPGSGRSPRQHGHVRRSMSTRRPDRYPAWRGVRSSNSGLSASTAPPPSRPVFSRVTIECPSADDFWRAPRERRDGLTPGTPGMSGSARLTGDPTDHPLAGLITGADLHTDVRSPPSRLRGRSALRSWRASRQVGVVPGAA